MKGGLCLAVALKPPFALGARARPSELIPSRGAATGASSRPASFPKPAKSMAASSRPTSRARQAILQLGRIALLADRLGEAQTWFAKALALRPDDADAKVLLAAAFYRADDFARAAGALQGVDVAHNPLLIDQYPTLNLAKLAAFKGQTPYALTGEGDVTHVAFVRTDPLPVVKVRVNGGPEVTFFVDTGNSEVALDSDFATEIGAPTYGAVQGTFSGGQHAEVKVSRIETLTLGDWTVRNVPAATLALRQLSKGLGVERIDGCIGTNLLYHFLATLDYPGGELVLRRKSAAASSAFAADYAGQAGGKGGAGAKGASGAVTPFWIASDHFMVGWSRIETLPPTLIFVDTGLAGAGVKLAEPVIKAAKIKLDQDKAEEGRRGRRHTLTIVPYTVKRLAFGGVTQDNVAGLYDGPFPWEDSLGFHLDGMVGHDFFKRYAVTFDFTAMRLYLR